MKRDEKACKCSRIQPLQETMELSKAEIWPSQEGEKGAMLEQGGFLRSPFGLTDRKVLMLDSLKVLSNPTILI